MRTNLALFIFEKNTGIREKRLVFNMWRETIKIQFV